MDGIILRVIAHYGEPRQVGGVWIRSGISHDIVTAPEQVHNDPLSGPVVSLLVPGASADYDVDALVSDFQDEYACKVNYVEGARNGNPCTVIEFDVFEPAWADLDEATDVVDQLSVRLSDWVQGYPMGR